MSYTAYILTPQSRKRILEAFPPLFPKVIAHHVTVKFPVPDFPIKKPPAADLKIVGYVRDESLEALVVSVNGSIVRSDGKIYHITLSLDPAENRKPVHSNDVIATYGYSIVDNMIIEATPEQIN